MSYRGLDFAFDDASPHLGGSVKAGDPFTYCPSVWNYVIERFGIESVLDLGSGAGNSALFFHRRGLAVLAVDGFKPSVLSSIFPAIMLDLTRDSVTTRVDLVHCQEVAEHIEERYLDNLMNSMLCGRIIIMTHALPGQSGMHHVNLQSSDYWIRQLEKRNATYLEEDTRRIRRLAETDGATYMQQSGLMFANQARL